MNLLEAVATEITHEMLMAAIAEIEANPREQRWYRHTDACPFNPDNIDKALNDKF